MKNIILALALLPAFVAVGSAQPAALTRIGVAGAVSGKVQAFPPAQAAIGRIIESGKSLFLNEKVTTDASGRLQIMLLDETVFTIGPNSAMLLNEFVYDPKTNVGTVSAKVTQGVFRFITGKVAHKDPSQMKVEFPVGTVGIRGTIVGGKVESDGSSLVVLLGPGAANNAGEHAGAFSLSNAGKTVDVNKAGFGSRITGPNNPPTPPAMIAAAELASILGAIAPPSKGSDGKEPEGAEGSKPSQAAGQDVAEAEGDLSHISTVGGAEDNLDSTANRASEDNITKGVAVTDGQSTWDQIRQNVPTGQGYYFSGEAPINCSGCLGSAPNRMASLQLQIDFGAKTVGGAGITNLTNGSNLSFIHLHGMNSSDTSNSIQSVINSMSFSSLSGNAAITLTVGTNIAAAVSSNGGSGTFNGSTISLINAGGVTAANALTNMLFTGNNTSGGGAVSANGSFTSPKF